MANDPESLDPLPPFHPPVKLEPILAGEPLLVRPPSRLVPVLRWMEQYPYRWLTGFLVVVIVALLVVVWGLAREAKRWAHDYQTLAAKNPTTTAAASGAADVRGKMAIVQQQLALAQDKVRTAQLMRVDALVLRDPWQALELLHDKAVFPDDQRDPAWHFYDDLGKRGGARVLGTQGVGVPCVAFNHHGTLLASGNLQGIVRLWNPATRQPRDLPESHSRRVLVLAWNKGDTRLASAGDDGKIVIWDVAAGKRLTTLPGHRDRVAGLAWHPDGSTLTSAGADGMIRRWNTNDGKEQASWNAGTTLLALALGHDGTTLAVAAGDNNIQLWDPATRQLRAVLYGHTDVLHDLAFSRDGKTLASGSADNTVRLWDVASAKALATWHGHTGGVTAVAWHPSGGWLASAGGDHVVRLWNIATGQEDVLLRGLPASPTSLSWSPGGATLAVSGFTDRAIHLWQPAPPPAHAVLTWQPWCPVALDRTGRFVAIVDRQAIHVRDNTGKVLAALGVGSLTALSPSPDGRWNAAVQGGKVVLKEAASNAVRAVLRGSAPEVTALLWSADSRTLATADANGTICLWQVATGEQRAVLRGHTDRVTTLAWSGDGRFLVSLSDDGTIRLWQVGPVPLAA